MVQFSWRARTSFAFTVTNSVMSLAAVAVGCTMVVRSVTVAVAKFPMASTVSYWSYLSSGFAVALCMAL